MFDEISVFNFIAFSEYLLTELENTHTLNFDDKYVSRATNQTTPVDAKPFLSILSNPIQIIEVTDNKYTFINNPISVSRTKIFFYFLADKFLNANVGESKKVISEKELYKIVEDSLREHVKTLK